MSNTPVWPSEDRINVIGQNGNDGEHYQLMGNTKMLTVNRKDFMNALKAVIVTAGKNDVRYYMNTVLVEVQREKVTLVSTDGHRITFATLTLNTGIEETQIDLVLDRPDVELLIKSVQVSKKLNTEELVIKWEGATVSVEASGTQFTFNKVDCKYPDWRRVTQDGVNLNPDRAGLTDYGINLVYLADAERAFKHLFIKNKYGTHKALLEFQTAVDKMWITPMEIESCGQLTEIKMAIMPMRIDS